MHDSRLATPRSRARYDVPTGRRRENGNGTSNALAPRAVVARLGSRSDGSRCQFPPGTPTRWTYGSSQREDRRTKSANLVRRARSECAVGLRSRHLRIETVQCGRGSAICSSATGRHRLGGFLRRYIASSAFNFVQKAGSNLGSMATATRPRRLWPPDTAG